MTELLDQAAPDSTRKPPAAGSPALRAIIVVGAIQALTMAFNLLRAKALALGVGPEGVGLISVLDQVVSVVAQVSMLSLPFATMKALSGAHSKAGDAFARTAVAFMRVLFVATLSGMALALIALIAYPEGRHVFF